MTYNPKTIPGYNVPIVDPASVDATKLATPREIVRAYLDMVRSSHHRSDDKKGNAASKKADALRDRAQAELEKAGWHQHIGSIGECEKGGATCRHTLYVHGTGGTLQVSEVPFAGGCNIDLLDDEVFTGEHLRPAEKALAMLRKRIGKPELDLDESDLDERTVRIVRAICAAEDIDEVQEVDGGRRTLRAGSHEWTWRDSDEEAEREAREQLTEDPELWKMAVADDHTTDSLEQWVEMVISCDGWEGQLCGYDGQSSTLSEKDNAAVITADTPDVATIAGVVYWRQN